MDQKRAQTGGKVSQHGEKEFNPFLACYAAGCHELVWEKPGYARFQACPEHRKEKA